MGGNEYEKNIFLASLISIPFLLCACQTQDNVKQTSSTEITTSKNIQIIKILMCLLFSFMMNPGFGDMMEEQVFIHLVIS